MEFQDFKNNYLKETVPEKKIEKIKSFSETIDKEMLSFFATQYKNESDGKVRTEIVEIIGNSKLDTSIALLIEALTDNFMITKKAAVISLGKIKIPSAIEPLLNMLSNPSLEINDEVIKSIVNIGKFGDVNGITKYFDKGNIHVKRTIPIILGKIQSEESIVYLKELLHKIDPEVRRNAVQALEKLIQAKDARLIINLLDDVDIDVKKACIKALSTIKSKRSIDPLLKLLKSKDKDVRNLTIQSLKYLFDSFDSYEKIYEIANSKNMIERKEAIKLLGLLEDIDSIDYMINSFKSNDNKTRKLAYNSLLQISKKSIPDQVFEGLKAKEWKIRTLCTKLIGKIGNEKQKSILLDLLEDSDNRVRDNVIDALSNIKDQVYIDKVKTFLNSSNWKSKRAAVKLLIKIGKEDCVDSLLPLVNDDDLFVRSWIALALGKFDTISDISPFFEMLKDGDPKIRIASAKALGQIGNKEALEPLAKSVWDDDWKVRKAVEEALHLIDPNWLKSF